MTPLADAPVPLEPMPPEEAIHDGCALLESILGRAGWSDPEAKTIALDLIAEIRRSAADLVADRNELRRRTQS